MHMYIYIMSYIYIYIDRHRCINHTCDEELEQSHEYETSPARHEYCEEKMMYLCFFLNARRLLLASFTFSSCFFARYIGNSTCFCWAGLRHREISSPL